MLIVCPSCATSYDVEPASLSPTGRQVRCARCRTIWHAEPSQADRLLLAAAAIAPDADDAGPPLAQPINAFASDGPGADGADDVAQAPLDGPMAADGAEPAVAESATAAEADIGGFEAPPIVPDEIDQGREEVEANDSVLNGRRREPAEDIETVAARRQRRGATRVPLRWPLSLVPTVIMVLALLDVIVVGWRSDIVRLLPQTASFYSLLGMSVNLRGLTFEDVATRTEQHEGVPILVVEGNVFNNTRRTEEVPRLKFIIRNAARQEIYSWTTVPSRAALSPGEAVSFRTRLASPPTGTRDLVLRFANRRDVVAGTR